MIEVVRSAQQFEELREPWQRLYRRARCESPFVTHAWLASWLQRYQGERHRVIVSRRGQELSSGLLAREVGNGWAAVDGHDTRSEVLFDGDEALALLLLHARAHAQRIELHGPSFDSYRARLVVAARGKFVVLSKNPWVTRAIAVHRRLDDYLASREAKVRRELRRKLRRFEERVPDATLTCLGRAERQQAIEVIQAVERESWKFEAGTAIHSSERDLKFYESLFDLGDDGGEPIVYVLASARDRLAFVLGIRHERRFYALKTSFSGQSSELSPGIVLFCRLLALLGPQGQVDRIELLGRDSRWKRELASERHERCVYELLANTLSSKIYSVAHTHVRPLIARMQPARAKV